ncbi:alpha/beta hydrolase [Staphylococcus pseudoxylosus]|uniref:Alpha/beta hydrolase n=4 Tax=Staphylococcus pseudoxylosus TaxID=2282419 RepID=A0AAQ0MGH8_9STAP|nr:alpha/beta hydrolase [Staphylococcus pseudoxylosus]MCE5002495.1 alpha/beta hydrolase [Staphylococcus pseudoxylosus]PTI82861.1 alpha/beta hydrolase [Staphylococcus xylosus]RMI85495.1 alpha/beta hydrolase [Staphylococcus pseudoxylosus]
MRKLWIWGICIIIIVIIVAFIVIKMFTQNQSAMEKSGRSNFVNSPIPTLFLHGYGGSANSEKYMVKQAEQNGVTKDVITAIVSKDGEVELKGKLETDTTNPIVKIELVNNKQGDLDENAKWFKNVLTKLQSEYDINKFNFVGHSMGNLSFAQYMLMYGGDPSLPQLNKQVNIAGTYNGVLNMNEEVNEISVDVNGKPSRMNPPYQELQQLEDIYNGKNIDVLNIFGDLEDGTHSDGRVSNSSSKSLKYLLGDSPESYKESKYKGESAQHSQLHENKEVARELIAFLWRKQDD